MKKAIINIPSRLSPTSLIRKPYRSLLDGDPGYAAFDKETINELLDQLSQRAPILDPMAGYGSLLDACSRKGISSVSVEISVPLYLWQLVRNPALSKSLTHIIDGLQKNKRDWPSALERAEVSDQWFVDDALKILKRLVEMASRFVPRYALPEGQSIHALAAAVIIPFCGRLACCTQSSNNPTWVKKGGMVVFADWQSDFLIYLESLKAYLSDIIGYAVPGMIHSVILGDCRQIHPQEAPFRSMVTSPPYPNRMDYHAMFGPEISFCSALGFREIKPVPSDQIIGSTAVRNTVVRLPDSDSARDFLDYVKNKSASLPGTVYDNKMYYYPYFANYFSSLTDAYYNVADLLTADFVGYIIVQNNFFRDREVPVSEVISEIWRNRGFQVEATDIKEVFHVGTKNPRSRGRKAKQSLYTLRVTR
jgi:hypothetical protein